jgi:C-terminal processing protease CtpA/Prc
MLKMLIILMLSFLFQGCQKDEKETEIITIDPQICGDQNLENIALWGYMNDWYLWNESLDHSTVLSDFSTATKLLNNIREKNPIDRYSFIMPKSEFDDAFINAQAFSYGMPSRLDLLNSALVVSFVFENSPAQLAGISRGDRIIAIAGRNIRDAITGNELAWEELWENIDKTKGVSFTLQKIDGTLVTRQLLQSAVTTNAVLSTQVIDSVLGNVGYLVYNSFIIPSHEELNQAFKHFNENNVTELIVDLRYNHGGSSLMSNQLASQIAGENVSGEIYNIPTNNANHQSDIEYFDLNGATSHLNLSSVIFITTNESASGSEVLINALKPHVKVKLVGGKTFGKPVGMLVSQLCDEVILAITHHNHNSEGEGDFFDGIPVDCPAIDNVVGDWGDRKDPMLAEALYLLENEQCSNVVNKDKNRRKPVFNDRRFDVFDDKKRFINAFNLNGEK